MTRWLVALLFLSSCTGMSTPDTATSTTGSTVPSPPPTGRYFAIGDSYTIGESVTAAERFPHQLARELDLPEPLIVAKTGWTTDELSNALDTIRVAGPYDLVTLLIGVNNQYRGRDAEQYRVEFAELLRRAINFAGDNPKKVIVVSIPDWGVTPFAEGRDRAKIAAEIDRYNAINREEAAKAGARYVDITPISRGNDPALVAGDGLHPSAKQYTEWVKLILPEAREAFR
jgi:lysophospholipase L1-like esterase